MNAIKVSVMKGTLYGISSTKKRIHIDERNRIIHRSKIKELTWMSHLEKVVSGSIPN